MAGPPSTPSPARSSAAVHPAPTAAAAATANRGAEQVGRGQQSRRRRSSSAGGPVAAMLMGMVGGGGVQGGGSGGGGGGGQHRSGTFQHGLHAWVVVKATEPGIPSWRSVMYLTVSLLLLVCQGGVMFAVGMESSHPRCTEHGQCKTGEWCAPADAGPFGVTARPG